MVYGLDNPKPKFQTYPYGHGEGILDKTNRIIVYAGVSARGYNGSLFSGITVDEAICEEPEYRRETKTAAAS